MSHRIPKHTKCRNCGNCCGVIPASNEEVNLIRDYLSRHPEVMSAIGPTGIIAICPFHDALKGRCIIYPVRPIVCRLMGVVNGMTCPNGNSRNLDGRKFLRGYSIENTVLLNEIDWKEKVK